MLLNGCHVVVCPGAGELREIVGEMDIDGNGEVDRASTPCTLPRPPAHSYQPMTAVP